MKCAETYYWLLAAESVDEPPRGVRKHLRHCPACQHRQKQILCLNQEIQQLPRPGESPKARKRLFRQLEVLPPPAKDSVPPLGPPVRRSWPMPVLRFSVVAACLMLALGLGWLLGG